MNIFNPARTKTSKTRFDALTLVENGLVYKYGKKRGKRNFIFGIGYGLY